MSATESPSSSSAPSYPLTPEGFRNMYFDSLNIAPQIIQRHDWGDLEPTIQASLKQAKQDMRIQLERTLCIEPDGQINGSERILRDNLLGNVVDGISDLAVFYSRYAPEILESTGITAASIKEMILYNPNVHGFRHLIMQGGSGSGIKAISSFFEEVEQMIRSGTLDLGPSSDPLQDRLRQLHYDCERSGLVDKSTDLTIARIIYCTTVMDHIVGLSDNAHPTGLVHDQKAYLKQLGIDAKCTTPVGRAVADYLDHEFYPARYAHSLVQQWVDAKSDDLDGFYLAFTVAFGLRSMMCGLTARHNHLDCRVSLKAHDFSWFLDPRVGAGYLRDFETLSRVVMRANVGTMMRIENALVSNKRGAASRACVEKASTRDLKRRRIGGVAAT
ncbi:hypothetical protein GUITHDRAFT_121407 [Guillardia theta CCMP2712]|uniref:Uncharacterized protein n=1 Tax=Guillardia theta (strain CCMP2712) TaxID=905079 RepID=L1I8J9_GUITC|nr:hypothetical protein GUITHDRAFT_121407 [Guillardia theta CCMP2712]EKX32402.1 hypothetical protein GUITHDRAFT_121407 [Guillardia theta CCMP2712]|eukprot:XP_005819382.1 hypothetical protein GUITHDRAFT_121407 [Guillardia theta CCMP2712]